MNTTSACTRPAYRLTTWRSQLASGIVVLVGLVPSLFGAIAIFTGSEGGGPAPSGPGAGVDTRRGSLAPEGRLRTLTATADGLLHYAGGSVVTSPPKVFLVFWGPGWGAARYDVNNDLIFSNDLYRGAPRLQEMFKGLGTGGELWSGVMTQYCQDVALSATSCPASSAHVAYPSGGALANVYYDDRPVPANPTHDDIKTEALLAASIFGNQPNFQFVIASPSGVKPDGLPNDKACAWHDSAASPNGSVMYTNLPYVMDAGSKCYMGYLNGPGPAGNLDGYTIVASHEYAETITDPVLSWGWMTLGAVSETADLCNPQADQIHLGAWMPVNVVTATGTFAMTATWSNDTNSCATAHAILPIRAQVPSLIGKTLTQAKQALTAAGLVLGTTGYRVDCNNLGLVSSESPAPGTTVLAGSAVNITIGTKPSPPAVCS